VYLNIPFYTSKSKHWAVINLKFFSDEVTLLAFSVSCNEMNIAMNPPGMVVKNFLSLCEHVLSIFASTFLFGQATLITLSKNKKRTDCDDKIEIIRLANYQYKMKIL
jgi:hypothetical protein